MKGGYVVNKKHFKIPNYSGAGIYAIVNMDSRKFYVGGTKNIRRRATAHNQALNAGKHQNSKLQQDISNNLSFIILHKLDCDVDTIFLRALEKIYMFHILSCGYRLYNIQPKDSMKCGSLENLSYSVVCDLEILFNIHDNFKNAILSNFDVANLCAFKTRKKIEIK